MGRTLLLAGLLAAAVDMAAAANPPPPPPSPPPPPYCMHNCDVLIDGAKPGYGILCMRNSVEGDGKRQCRPPTTATHTSPQTCPGDYETCFNSPSKEEKNSGKQGKSQGGKLPAKQNHNMLTWPETESCKDTDTAKWRNKCFKKIMQQSPGGKFARRCNTKFKFWKNCQKSCGAC